VARGHNVQVFTTNVDGAGLIDAPVATPVDIDGVQVRYFPLAMPKRIYYSPRMARAIDNEIASFDVAHINGMFLWPGPKLVRSAARAGVPFVVSPRGMLMPEMIAGRSTFVKHAWIRLLARRGLAAAAAIHATSEEEASGIRRLGLDLCSLVVIGNGAERPLQPSATDIDRLWGNVPAGRRIAFLGRLDWTKGVDLAIDAVRGSPPAHLLIAGHDQIGLRELLEPMLLREDATMAGRFIGPVDGIDKWALLKGADLLLAPSVKESFGIAVVEALAVGTPVICTEGVGASTIVRRLDRRCVVPRNAETLAQAMRALLAEPERRAEIGAKAREMIAGEYSWEAISQQMESVYERAVARRSVWDGGLMASAE
jgi:glycosyltransferase involved in cell wall biosynthesis